MFIQPAREAVIIMLAAVVVAAAVHLMRPDKITLAPPAAPSRAGEAVPPMAEVSLDEAKRLFDEKTAVFADARPELDYADGHIRDALNLIAAEQERWLSDFLARTDPTTVIVTYCDGEACHLATELAELLLFNGFDNVRYLRNGWTRWRDSGFPTER